MGKITVTVYGAEQICASCVGAPGSKDTYEWLQAAIGRKYLNEGIIYSYIDINEPPNTQAQQQFAEHILEDNLFYPVVLINGELIAEGIPRLKSVFQALDNYGAVKVN